MSAERPTFPDKPLRRVLQEPKPAVINRGGDELGFKQEKDGQLYFWDNISESADSWKRSNELEFGQEKDGQLYFWDNILQFPDSWTKPNEQIRVLPRISLPKILLPLEAYEAPKVKTPANPKVKQLEIPGWESLFVPEDYISLNQLHFMGLERNGISRIMELKATGEFLHRRIVNTFNLDQNASACEENELPPIRWPEEDITDGRGWFYPNREEGELPPIRWHEEDITDGRGWFYPKLKIQPQPKKPTFTFSVVYSKTKKPSSEFGYEQTYPEGIAEGDREDFAFGIERITEYATNFATREFFRRNLDIPGFRKIAEAYGLVEDFLTYRVLLHGTYRDMGEIQKVAKHNGKDFKGAIIDYTLFQQDTESLDRLIKDTKSLECSNINDLAIRIGNNRLRTPDLTKILRKLELKPTDSEKKANLKNCIMSVLSGGVYRNPGITEVSGGILTFLTLETLVVYLLSMGEKLLTRENIDLLALNLATASIPVTLTTIFAIVHEAIHHYSSDQRHLGGIIPAEIRAKRQTPGMAEIGQPDNS